MSTRYVCRVTRKLLIAFSLALFACVGGETANDAGSDATAQDATADSTSDASQDSGSDASDAADALDAADASDSACPPCDGGLVCCQLTGQCYSTKCLACCQ